MKSDHKSPGCMSSRSSVSSSFGPLSFLSAGYGRNAEKLGAAAKKLKDIANKRAAEQSRKRNSELNRD